MVAVMEETDVPAPPQTSEKVEQGARALRELEAHQHLVADPPGMPTHHVADMQLGGLVVGHIQDAETPGLQPCDDLAALLIAPPQLHAHENLGATLIGVAVIELGDLALAQGAAKLQETARALGDLHRQQALAPLSQLRPFGHVS